jgi:type IV secretion system protein VirB10
LISSQIRASDDMLQRSPIGQLPGDYTFLPPEPEPAAPEPAVTEVAPAPTEPEPQAEPEIDPDTQRRLEALRKEMEAAMDSPVVFANVQPAATVTAPTPVTTPTVSVEPHAQPHAPSDEHGPRSDAHNRAFLQAAANVRTRVAARMESPWSPYELQAGTIIPAALVTGINSDLPGDVIGQVTANVFDSVSGRYLLVPQGTRMIGKYNSEVLNGQNRVLVAWQRLILPNGRSIVLEAMPGTDPVGVAGMADLVDYHLDRLATATLVSTFVALGGNFAANTDRQQNQELAVVANTVAQQSSRVAQRIIDRELNVKPTIMIRSGIPLNVLVNRDLELEPYQPHNSHR